MQASKYVKLIPKTGKAKNKIREAGWPDHWIVVDEKDMVPFSERDGPWLHVTPDNNNNDKSRWVHQHNDNDFIVKES